MGKIKEMFEDYKTKEMAKKYGRTFEQQKYRNTVVKKIKGVRQYSSDLAKMLLEKEKGNFKYVESLGKGRKAGKDVVKQLIQSGYLDYVLNNIRNGDKFEGLDNEIAEDLINVGKGYFVAELLDNFEGVDHKEISQKLIEKGYGEYVAKYIYNFDCNNKEIADKLIEKGEFEALLQNLDNFAGLDYSEIAKNLIKTGGGLYVIKYLYKFEGLDGEIAKKLIEQGEIEALVKHLGKFDGLDKEIAKKLIEQGEIEALVKHLDKFDGLDKEIAENLIEAGGGLCVVRHPDKFEGLNNKNVANMLIKKGKLGFLIRHLDKFEGLDEEIAGKLIKAGCGDVVEEYPEVFGFKKEK